MEEIWKDIDEKLEVSSLGRVRSKIVVIKGENLGDGLEIIPPKYLRAPKPKAVCIPIIKGKISVYLKEPFIKVYAKVFKVKKNKKHRWHLIDEKKPLSLDNLGSRKLGPLPKGENPLSHEKLKRDVVAFKKDYATGMVSLTNFI